MAELLVREGKGIKNQFRLSQSNFLSIPSIAEVDLGNQPLSYEAYLYAIIDLITGIMYIGVHKLSDKTYWTSMTHTDGLTILQGDEKRIKYVIV